MPHGLCNKFDTPSTPMDFKLDDFNIVNNPRGRFDGEYTSIFYHYGRFPMYAFGNKDAIDNGGIPQRGNLTLHMEDAMRDILEEIPNYDFGGLAVINQEEWRPLFERNFGWKDIYQDKSIDYYIEQHPAVEDEETIIMGAAAEFETWSKNYTVESLRLGRMMRPGGLWGYYAYPYCYNFKTPVLDQCKEATRNGNSRMKYLWEESSVILPSIYFFVEYEPEDRAKFLYSQIEEGVRVARLSEEYTPVYVYTKMKYNMSFPVFPYREQDMFASLRMPADFGVEGIILWGSDPEFKTAESCKIMKTYVQNVIGPYVKRVNQWVGNCSKRNCNGNGRCVHRGALDRKYREEIYRLTMEELLDFSISNYKHICRCLPGYSGSDCSIEL